MNLQSGVNQSSLGAGIYFSELFSTMRLKRQCKSLTLKDGGRFSKRAILSGMQTLPYRSGKAVIEEESDEAQTEERFTLYMSHAS